MPEVPPNPSYTRKACLSDFLDDCAKPVQHTKNQSHNDSVNIEKNQQEYGNKKRIKPWRTGTKSQQQIAPRGYKKGFRG